MKANIFGDRYNFLIEFEKYGKKYSFEILCVHNQTNQKSVITNLNFIISELVFPVLKNSDTDTTILLNEMKGVALFRKSISIFKDKLWIKLLENKLDEDRNIGGWNSNFEMEEN